MKKGVIEMCILYLISKKDFYGYDIMKTIQPHFPDVAESTFYAMGEKSDGPPRKYYKITETGKNELIEALNDWSRISESVEDIIR